MTVPRCPARCIPCQCWLPGQAAGQLPGPGGLGPAPLPLPRARAPARRLRRHAGGGGEVRQVAEPVDAGSHDLVRGAREARDLTTRARSRKLTPDELTAGTFTISNLGMYGIRQFTAVINPPQAAILAVGEAVRQPVVRGDQVTIGTIMTLTLSIDHRAVDGATAASFLTRLRELIEEPLDIVI